MEEQRDYFPDNILLFFDGELNLKVLPSPPTLLGISAKTGPGELSLIRIGTKIKIGEKIINKARETMISINLLAIS